MSTASDSALDTRVDASDRTHLPRAARTLLGLVRIALGWTLLWAGLDKLFGLGFATAREASVISGVSPAAGFLQHGLNPEGPAYGVLSGLGGNIVIDVLFMAGLLGCGLAILLGVVMRIATVGAAILFVMLWFASLPLENNPFWDQHLFWGLSGLMLMALGAGRYLGLGNWWNQTAIVRRFPVLA